MHLRTAREGQLLRRMKEFYGGRTIQGQFKDHIYLQKHIQGFGYRIEWLQKIQIIQIFLLKPKRPYNTSRILGMQSMFHSAKR